MRSKLGARGHSGKQVVVTHLNRASAEAEARENQPPALLRELREAAHSDLVSEATELLSWLRAQERLEQIETEVSDAGVRIADLEASRAETQAEQDTAKADAAELPWKQRDELNLTVRSLARRVGTLGDSVSQTRKRISDLESEAGVLATIERPSTPALVALRDALTD